jgi:hypothetical protein
VERRGDDQLGIPRFKIPETKEGVARKSAQRQEDREGVDIEK